MDDGLRDTGVLPLECYVSAPYPSGSAANAMKNLESTQFAFFDFETSSAELVLLSEIQIHSFISVDTIVTEYNLVPKVFSLVYEALSDQNDASIMHVTNIIVRVMQQILSASGYEFSRLNLITHPPSYDDNGRLDWHVDKALEEIIGANTPAIRQNIFIFTLKGNSTLFYPLDESMRLRWQESNLEFEYSYGGSPVQSLITNHSNLHCALPGQASIHLAGKFGTVHSAPINAPNGRLVLIAKPENFNLIKQANQLERTLTAQALEHMAA